MAVVRYFKVLSQGQERPQPEAEAAMVGLEIEGEKFVQLNGYGSANRVNAGARSQNIRLSQAAFEQLVEFGQKYFSEKK